MSTVAQRRVSCAAVISLLFVACGGGGSGAGGGGGGGGTGGGITSSYAVARLVNRRASGVLRAVVVSETNPNLTIERNFPYVIPQGGHHAVALREDSADRRWAIERVEYQDGTIYQRAGQAADANPFTVEPGHQVDVALPPATAEPLNDGIHAYSIVLVHNPMYMTSGYARVYDDSTPPHVQIFLSPGAWQPGVTHAFALPGPYTRWAWELALFDGGGAVYGGPARRTFDSWPGHDTTAALPGFAADDPLYPNQWHLRNTMNTLPGRDCNVEGAWAKGITGAGVIIRVVDDGLELLHADLGRGSTPTGMDDWDFFDNDRDPTGGLHGTAVAGVATAAGGNAIGVTGVAPRAMPIGSRLIVPGMDPPYSLAPGEHLPSMQDYGYAMIGAGARVCNNSWAVGEVDSFTPPIPGVFDAIDNNPDVCFVMAAGNDRTYTGNANLSGTHQHRALILVAATGPDGKIAYSPCVGEYSSPGACLLVSAPSSGQWQGVYYGSTTTDRSGNNTCPFGYNPRCTNPCGTNDQQQYADLDYSNSFDGTSSATPVVSGVIALMLQANPALSPRDVRWILATTAVKNDASSAGWFTNAAGLHFSHDYGFGVVDATAAVRAARGWTNLAAERFASVTVPVNQPIADNSSTALVSTITLPNNGDWPAHLEYAQLTILLGAPGHPRGRDLNVSLISPSGTKALLALSGQDQYVNPNQAVQSFSLGATLFLGEPSVASFSGQWTLHISDTSPNNTASIVHWTLNLWGHD